MELFKLLGTISIDTSKADQAIDETTGKAKDAEKEQKSAWSKIGSTAASVGKGVAAAGAVMGGAFIAAVEGTREYRVSMGKLETAFTTSGHSATTAHKTYSELNSVLGDSDVAVEASNHLAKLCDNEDELSTWTDICTGVFATFGDSLPIEGLTEAANETAKTGQLTGGLTDALNWAGESEDKFQKKLDACSTEQERQKLITSTMNKLYGESADAYKKNNKELIDAEKANQKLKDTMAKLGEVGEPIMTAIKNAIASMAEKAIPVIEDLGVKIQDLIKWFKENESKVKLWAGAIGIAMATAAGFVLVLSWSAIMTKAANALKIVTVAMKALNVAMRANLIGLIVTAIIGLVAAFIYLWKNCESFRKFWINLWKIITKAAAAAWAGIKSYFSNAWKDIKRIWNGAGKFFSGVWSGIKKVFSGVVSFYVNIYSKAWSGVKFVWSKAKSFFSNLWSGIKGVFGSVGSWFKGKFQSAWTGIKSVFSGWGSFFGGLWTKIKSKFSTIGTSIGSSMGKAVRSGMNSVIGLIERTVNKGIGLINSAIDMANKLPIVNVGHVPTLKLPRLAKGGVLERGQIGLLEGTGAEAIVPLENNKKWLRSLAIDLDNIQRSRAHGAQNGDLSVFNTKLDKLIDLLENMQQMRVILDSGALVGELTPAINVKMGDLHRHTLRGNTR